MRRVGLIGYGAIGRAIAASLRQTDKAGFDLVALLTRSAPAINAAGNLPGTRITDALDDFLAASPEVVIEAAGHDSVSLYGEAVLRAGCEFHILSTGVFADDDFTRRLVAAARTGSTRIVIPSGALAGFDGLRALRAGGLDKVTYTSIKPPVAWLGTPAAADHDLTDLAEPRTIFEGSAREAAVRFPRNANLAATVALAGLGFEATRVRLVADPHCSGNTGRVVAEGPHGRIEAIVSGSSEPDNPKTSAITAYSVIAALRNTDDIVRFL